MASQIRRNHRRSKRALLWAAAVIVLAHIISGYLLDYHWPEMRFPSVARTLNVLQAQAQTPDIVCLGSSRFGAGFCEEEVQRLLRQETTNSSLRVFNASIETGDLVAADEVMKRVLEQGARPPLVVVEVSPETLARRNLWLGEHVRRQLTWPDVPAYFEEICISGNFGRLLGARSIPLFVHRRQLCQETYGGMCRWFAQSVLGVNSFGLDAYVLETKGVPWEVFMKMNSPVFTPPQRTQAGLHQIRKWLKDYELGGNAAIALDRLVRRCREREIDVILVGVPVASAHRELYTPEIEAAFLSHMNDIAERQDCRFVDFRARIPDRLFLDNHHLLKEGGLYFSRELTSEVLAPAWQAREQFTVGRTLLSGWANKSVRPTEQ